uniref:hypothetical protein n=1 Tax=Porodaedalea mongolica TaxID=2651638 RepID=UPI0021AC973D|nr:hypothetical protein NYK79_mgp23 [Porodaedalea mongolica]UUA03967.1 hypothetical protein [Porodaedalea mongolica]WCF76734.1 hypothetical protein [Porodaedalea mongolica]
MLLKPFFSHIAQSALYPKLWSFAGYLITNLGFIRGVILLFSVRQYIYGNINISALSNVVFNSNPIVSTIFDTAIKSDLLKIRYQNVTTQLSVRKLINWIIVNSFLLVIKSLFKFIVKIFSIIIVTVLGIFWIGSFNKFKSLLGLAFEIKDFIREFIHIDLPIPKNLINHKSWYADGSRFIFSRSICKYTFVIYNSKLVLCCIYSSCLCI